MINLSYIVFLRLETILPNNQSDNHIFINLKYRRKSAAEVDLPPEDDMSTAPCPRSPKKSLGEVYIEKGLLPP